MNSTKLQYWNDKIAVKFGQINKNIHPLLNDVEDYTIHVDPDSKAEMRQKIDGVHTAMRALAVTIDKSISKKARELITHG